MAIANLFNLAKNSIKAKMAEPAAKPTPFSKPVSPALSTQLSPVTSAPKASPFNLTKLNPLPELQMGFSSVQNRQKRINELKAKAASQGLTAAEAAEYAQLTGAKITSEAVPKFGNISISQGDKSKAPSKAWEAVQSILNPNKIGNKTDNELARSPQQDYTDIGGAFIDRINEKFPNLGRDANNAFKDLSKRLEKPMPVIFDPLKTAGKQIAQGGLDLTGGLSGKEEPKIVEGLKGTVFGALGFTPGGAIFNAAIENPTIKPYAEEAFGYLDEAKQGIRNLPAIQGLPEEVKDLVDVGVELAAFGILHKVSQVPFKKSQTVEIAHPVTGKMTKVKVPVDTAGWRSFKETLADQLSQIKKNPIEFLKQQQVGLSIKTVNQKPTGVPEKPAYNPKTEAERIAMDNVKEMVKKQEAARKADKPSIQERARAALDDFQTKFYEQWSVPDRIIAQKQKEGGYSILPKDRLDLKVDEFHKANEIAGQFVKDKGFEKIMKEVPDIDAFNQYLIARHAQTLESKGKTQLSRDKVKDQAILDGLKDTYEPLAQRVTQYTQDVLDYMVESNLISAENAAKLRTDYPTYVPLNKIFSEFEMDSPSNFANSANTGSISKQTVVQKLGEGSKREIENPLESILDYTYRAHTQGLRNQVAKGIADLRNLPGFEGIIKVIKKPEKAKGKSTISYLDKGKKVMVEVPESFARAAKNLNVETLDIFSRMMSKSNRVFKTGTTALNIPFAMSNVAKDIMTAWINSPYYKLSPTSFVEAITAAVGKNDLYQEMVRAGGGGKSVDLTRPSPKLTVEGLRAQKSVPSKIANTIKNPKQWLETVENIVSVSEEFNRVKVFNDTKKALLKQGYGEKNANILAAQESRNATANFSRGGELKRYLNAFSPFMSAGISGARSFNKAFKRDPAGTSLKIASTILLPEVVSVLWNTADPEKKKIYDSFDEYEKDGNFIIIGDNAQINPDTGKWEGVYKIPKPPGISDIAVPVRKAIEQIQNVPNSEVQAQDLLGAIISPTTSIPLDNPTNYAVPQITKPLVEVFADKNLFTGAPVDTAKANERASGSAKFLADKFPQLSAAQIDYLRKGYLGGASEHVTNAVDQGLAAVGTIDPEDVGGKSILQDIKGRFMEVSGNREATKIYEIQDKLKEEKTASNRKLKEKAQKIFDSDESKEVKKQQFKDFALTLKDEDDQDYFVKQVKELIESEGFAGKLGEEQATATSKAIQSANADVLFEVNKADIERAISLPKEEAKEILGPILNQADSEEEQEKLVRLILEARKSKGL